MEMLKIQLQDAGRRSKCLNGGVGGESLIARLEETDNDGTVYKCEVTDWEVEAIRRDLWRSS